MGKNEYSIDFFELMFLAESVIPPNPIARSMCFDSFSEKHYHNMNDKQRLQFFTHVQNCNGFNIQNEQCKHFVARFNPDNQYLINTLYNGKKETLNCYLYDNEYRTSINQFVDKKYIESVEKLIPKH